MSDLDLRELTVDRSDAVRPSVKHRRRLWTRYALPLLLIFGFIALVGWSSRDLLFRPRSVRVVPVIATASEAARQGTPLFQAAGWIEPRPTPIRVAALAPGVVESLRVVEDQFVRAGEPIAELIKTDARLQLERAEADLALRQAELEEAEAAYQAAKTRFEQPVHLEAALSEAETMLAKAETAIKNLPFELRRAEADARALRQEYESKLAAQGAVAGVTITSARGKADAATALVEELRGRAESLEKERDAATRRREALQKQLQLLIDETRAKNEARANINAAKARLEQTRVAVAQAQLQCERMTIVAPVDGRIFRLIAHPGARVGHGVSHTAGYDGSTVVTMYRPEMLQVRVDVRFENLRSVSLDQPVRIDNPAIESPLTGSVLFISSEADIQKNTLQVKVAIPDPPKVFKPEMLVDVTFLSPQRASHDSPGTEDLVLQLPRELIHQDDTGSYVWLADQSEGIASKRSVDVGAVNPTGMVEIRDGLNASSRIISTGSDGIEHGQRIVITGEDTLPTADRSAANIASPPSS